MRWQLLAVLLFISGISSAKTYHYKYTAGCAEAYRHYMALKPVQGRAAITRELVADPYNLMATYLSDYEDCLQLLFNGSRVDYNQLKHHQQQRLNLMERGDINSPWHRLCKAGIYMHWAFVNTRFNENLKAANNFRKSYALLKENRRLFPSFEYNDIFWGIEEATVGAIPDNYKWIASIFGVKGNIKEGMRRVESFIQKHDIDDPLYREAIVYYAYMTHYLLSDKERAWQIVSGSNFSTNDNLLNSFVKCNIALNYRKADQALHVLKNAMKIDGYNNYPIFEYEYGYTLLHKLDAGAVNKFNDFLKKNKSPLFIKDTWQKLAYAHYLENNMQMAIQCRNKITTMGTATTDADKQAMRFAQQQNTWPNKTLLKAQLLIDGGFYEDARAILIKTKPDDYSNTAHKLEYYFRLARVYDETGHVREAVEYYNTAINTGRNRQEQFAARAALQLGFLYERLHKKDMAIKMYQLAMSMEDHDFKNSIDQQAKAGVGRLSQ